MKGFDVLKVKAAVKDHNKFDLSRTHLTTMEFGQILPLFNEETVPGDKFEIDANYFSRMAPLVKPTYGKFDFKTVAAFVPYYMVAEDADAWLAGKTSWEGSTPVQRWFDNSTLYAVLSSSTYGVNLSINDVTAGTSGADWTYINSQGAVYAKKWTAKGRFLVNVLNSLG